MDLLLLPVYSKKEISLRELYYTKICYFVEKTITWMPPKVHTKPFHVESVISASPSIIHLLPFYTYIPFTHRIQNPTTLSYFGAL